MRVTIDTISVVDVGLIIKNLITIFNKTPFNYYVALLFRRLLNNVREIGYFVIKDFDR